MTNQNDAGRAARLWSGAVIAALLVYVVVVAAAVTGVVPLGSELLGVALVGGLAVGVAKGFRWARTVLTVITVIQAINIFTDPYLGAEGQPVWLPTMLRAGYVSTVAVCLWGLYRHPAAVFFSRPEAFVTTSASLRRAGWRAVLVGSAASFIASLVLALWAIARLEQQNGVRADFGTNGLNWIGAWVALVGMGLPLYLLLALFVVVPHLARHPRGQHFKNGHIVAVVLLPELVIAGLFAAAGNVVGNVVDRTASIVCFGPPLVVTAWASYWYLKRRQSETVLRVGGPDIAT